MKPIEQLQSERILLIVDDDPESCQLLANLLREHAYTPVIAHSGESALDVVTQTRPDMILLDVWMPGLDGFEVCRRLKDDAETRNIPVIFISVLDDEENVLEGFEVGGADYITKPFRPKEVWARVQTHLELRDLHQRLEARITGQAIELQEEIEEHRETARLWASEHYLLRKLVDAVPDYIFIKDREGRFLLSNVAHAAAAGLAPDDLIGKVATDVFPGSVASQFDQDDEKVLQTGQPLISIERLTIDSQGNPKWVLTTKIPLTNPSGEVTGLVGMSRDVTERKLVQEALEESERSYRKLYERAIQQAHFTEFLLRNMPVGVLLLAADEKIAEANPALHRMTGYSENDLKNQTLCIFCSTDDYKRVATFFQTVITERQGIIRSCETEFLCKDGSHVPVRIQACRLENADGEIVGVLSTIEDVTQYRLTEEARQTAEILRVELEKEKELRDLKSRFISTMSHEFRTPLATIQAATEALENYTDRMSTDQQKKRFHKIRHQIQLLTKLLENVLTMDNIETLGVDFRPEQVDLAAFVRNIVVDFQNAGTSQPIQFVYELTDPCLMIVADRTLLHHIISSLISNAVNYSAPESTIQVQIDHVSGQDVVIKVIDTGIGIPQDEQAHIFSNFYRASNTIGIPGAGLGLVIAKHAVDKHGGTMTFESTPNVGTVFTVKLPRTASALK